MKFDPTDPIGCVIDTLKASSISCFLFWLGVSWYEALYWIYHIEYNGVQIGWDCLGMVLPFCFITFFVVLMVGPEYDRFGRFLEKLRG